MAVGYQLNRTRLEVRSTRDGSLAFIYPTSGDAAGVAISQDGSIVALGAADSVWLFRLSDGGRACFRFGFTGYRAGPVALSRDGRWFIATAVGLSGGINRAWCFRDGGSRRGWG